MAYRKSRRVFRKSRRGMRYLKRKREMARIKKDIMKCNFPTKIKFMGLPERKTMFLQKEITLKSTTKEFSISLNPFDTANFKTLLNGNYPNWDKIKVLAIYVKMTPNRNTWSTTGGMHPIKCFYTINNANAPNTYDKALATNKQLFVFNCNENFTIYLGKPQTMTASDGVIYKPGQWFSVGEFTSKDTAYEMEEDEEEEKSEDDKQKRGMIKDDEEEKEDDEEDFFIGTTADGGDTTKSTMSCGRLHFISNGIIDYTISISYKVALKG